MTSRGLTDAALGRQLSMITGGSGATSSAGVGAGAGAAVATAATAIAQASKQDVKDKQSLGYVVRTGIAGGLAGCAAKTVVGPLDRVKILFQASSPQFAKYSGSWAGLVTALQEIGRTEGTRGLFRGHSATLLRVFPYAGIKFLAYEQIRHVIIPTKDKETAGRRLVSGSLAGLVSVFFTYPLEIIRVRLAFETKRDGAARGSLLRICNQIYHERPPLRPAGKADLPPSIAAISGINGNGGTAASLTAATVRATSQAVDAVTPQAGLANFYRGFSPTLLGMVPYAGMSFLTHDTMGDILRSSSLTRYTTVPDKTDRNGRSRLTNTAELLAGAVAGLVGQTSAYPLEIIRRRMQVGGAIGDGHRLRISETAAKIWLERGWRGFFVGLSIGYSKVIPMGAVSFWTYEKCKQWLGV